MAAKPPLLSAYVETVPGLEEVAWLEIRQRFPQAEFAGFLFAKNERGIAVFKAPAKPSDLFALDTVDAIFLTAAFLEKTTRGYRDLRRLRDQLVLSGDFGRALNAFSRYRRRQVQTYRLVARTYGKHEYDRQALRRAVIQAIEELYPDWQRVQTDAGVEVWANVLGSSILVGLHLPPPRDWRTPAVAGPPAAAGPLPQSVAAALSLLSEPRRHDIFLDPFLDGGAIVSARSASPVTLILSGAHSSLELSTALETVTAGAPSSSQPALFFWNATALPLPASAVNKIATRFPAAPAADVTRQYVQWLQEMQRVLRPAGQAVVLTRAFEQFKDAIREAPYLEIRSGYSVTVSREWGRIYLLQRHG